MLTQFPRGQTDGMITITTEADGTDHTEAGDSVITGDTIAGTLATAGDILIIILGTHRGVGGGIHITMEHIPTIGDTIAILTDTISTVTHTTAQEWEWAQIRELQADEICKETQERHAPMVALQQEKEAEIEITKVKQQPRHVQEM